MPCLQRQISDGVSRKWCCFLWLRKKLKPTLNWKRWRRPLGSCKPKIDLDFGRKKDKRCSFRVSRVGKYSKLVMIPFQEEIASGKKLFLYLSLLNFISRKTVFRKGWRYGGNLSLKEFWQILFSFEYIFFNDIQNGTMWFCPNFIHRNGRRVDVHIPMWGPDSTVAMFVIVSCDVSQTVCISSHEWRNKIIIVVCKGEEYRTRMFCLNNRRPTNAYEKKLCVFMNKTSIKESLLADSCNN